MPPSLRAVPPLRALFVLRIIWCAIIGAQIICLALFMSGTIPPPQPANPIPFKPMIAWGMLATFVPFTYFFRTMTFRKFQIEGQIPARVYATGNLIFWAGCEGVAYAGIIFGFIGGSFRPFAPIIAIALALQALTFPLADKLYNP